VEIIFDVPQFLIKISLHALNVWQAKGWKEEESIYIQDFCSDRDKIQP